MKSSAFFGVYKQPRFWLGLLLITTLAAYIQVARFEFVNFDDGVYVTLNPFVREGPNLQNILWVFTHFHDSNWFPLTWISHMLSYRAFGMNAGGHHLVNVALHLLNTHLLFVLFMRLCGEWKKALVIAGVFALHPLHVESVAWVAERKDVLSGFFWMATLIAYVQYARAASGRGRLYAKTMGLFILGLMSKSMLVTLPCVFFLLDYWPLERLKKGAMRRLILEKIPFFIFSAMASAAAFWAQRLGNAIPDLEKLPLDVRFQNALVSYAKYLKKFFYPFDLAIYYPYSHDTIFIGKVIAAVFTLLIITLIVVQHGRRHKYLVTGWFWYLGVLVPVSGIIQAGGQSMADRYTYLPLIGVTIMGAWGIPALFSGWSRGRQFLQVSAVSAMIILAFLCSHQVAHWQNTETLFSQAVRVTKRNMLAHENLADFYSAQGRLQEAAYHYEQASMIQDRPNTLNNLGNTYFLLGRIDDAMRVYAEVIQKDPKQAMAMANLGIMLAEKRRFKEAEGFYAHAIEADPDYVSAYTAWAETLLRQARFYDAWTKLQRVLERNPRDPVALYFLGILHAQAKDFESRPVGEIAEEKRLAADYTLPDKEFEDMFFYEGDLETAFGYFEKALSLNPQFYLASMQWGIILAKLGRYDEAANRLEQVLDYQPRNGLIYSHLGRVRQLQKRYESALEYYAAALQLKADLPRLHKRMGDLFGETGNREEALRHYEEALYLLPGYKKAEEAMASLKSASS